MDSSELANAIADSVAAGLRELETLRSHVVEAGEALLAATVRLTGSAGDSEEDNAFALLMSNAAEALERRIDASREVVETFNIAFFGRTGAGKSTLMSALGGLNGARVSPGPSDWTTEVEDIKWNGCRLYDTPGTGGWGRTRSRAELEENARRAVEFADVVILCFDTQGQQQAEFELVADWVRAYGKPAIAVLNFRNSRWRHPAKTHDVESRRALSDTVRQHVDNINGELAAIGLPGVPVVALNSKRALTARAGLPYRGPSPPDFEGERSKFGVPYLDEWSNLRVLEDLIAACLSIGGTDLRLASLREGTRSALQDWSAGLQRFGSVARDRAEVTERAIGQMLDVLGYPDAELRMAHLGDEPNGDLLTILEQLREEPFDAQVTGRLGAHGRHLLRAHLGAERKKALRRAEDLIMDAFDSKKTVDAKKFDKRVFDRDNVAAAVAAVARKVDSFLNDQLQLAGQDAVEDLRVLEQRSVQVKGSAGSATRVVGTILRTSGVAAGGAGAVLAFVATTNFWNPAGWTAALVLGGLSVVSAFTGWLGKKARKRAEKQRVRARAKAIGSARSGVSSQFDLWETEQLDTFVDAAWGQASSLMRDLLQRGLEDRHGILEVNDLARSLAERATAIPGAPRPEGVIARAVDLVVASASDPDATEADVLLGESWIQHQSDAAQRVFLTKTERSAFRRKAEEDSARLRQLLAGMSREPQPATARAWLLRVSQSGVVGPDDVSPPSPDGSGSRPPLVMIGDYDSGKTSLAKRLLAEAGQPVPASLAVRGNPTTTATSEHELGRFVLVDTPGFQGGREGHDDVALAAAVDAAVVVVVVHINLLLGDTSLLAEILQGSSRVAGKAARCVFVIGRIDELGVDPETVPGTS